VIIRDLKETIAEDDIESMRAKLEDLLSDLQATLED